MAQAISVRRSAIAGAWYPGTAPALRQTIQRFFSSVEKPAVAGEVVALLSPHAGYAYSGPVAAYAYRAVQGETFDRVVVAGPLHRGIPGARLEPVMTSAEAAYETPLGEVPLDRPFLNALARRFPIAVVAGDQEHSLEIQLPFLQEALGRFAVAPLILAEAPDEEESLARCLALGEAVAATARAAAGRTLLVASSDLAHLDDYRLVVAYDKVLEELIAAFDLEGLIEALVAGRCYACGGAAIVAVMAAARALGAARAQVLRYATSGDVTGDKRPGTYTVGYLAAAFIRERT
jgi:AmmeMemoRadiSam system protein B